MADISIYEQLRYTLLYDTLYAMDINDIHFLDSKLSIICEYGSVFQADLAVKILCKCLCKTCF